MAAGGRAGQHLVNRGLTARLRGRGGWAPMLAQDLADMKGEGKRKNGEGREGKTRRESDSTRVLHIPTGSTPSHGGVRAHHGVSARDTSRDTRLQ